MFVFVVVFCCCLCLAFWGGFCFLVCLFLLVFGFCCLFLNFFGGLFVCFDRCHS